VTYSNEAKHAQLKVPKRLLAKFGAVSREAVEAMVKNGSDNTHACIAVSGIAGPAGGSEDNPVGTVWIAAVIPDGDIHTQRHRFAGSRSEVRQRAVNQAFGMLIGLLEHQDGGW